MDNEMVEDLVKFLNSKLEGYEAHIIKKNINRLPANPAEPGILLKHAWIVWTVDENHNIQDLQVYELNPELPYKVEKTREYVCRITKEKKIPFLDIYCAPDGLRDWDIADILFKFGFQYRFSDYETALRCAKRLAYIAEFRDRINAWIEFF